MINFICPDNYKIASEECLKKCRLEKRCLDLIFLKELAGTTQYYDNVFSVTDITNEPRVVYLWRKNDISFPLFFV